MEAYFLMCSCKAKKNNYEINVSTDIIFNLFQRHLCKKKMFFKSHFGGHLYYLEEIQNSLWMFVTMIPVVTVQFKAVILSDDCKSSYLPTD